jgi:cobalt/nickel transport system permease protein
MHLSDGIVTAPILAGGTAVAAVGLAVGLKKLKPENVPRVAILSSTFFVASLIHVPMGPISVHLVLNGVHGLLLGWAAFPSIFVALTFQMLLFHFGGITVLGLNTLAMAFPAVVVYLLFGKLVSSASNKLALVAGFLAGSLSVLGGGFVIAFLLFLSGEHFLEAASLALAAHLPVSLLEGFFTSVCVGFLRKVKPEMLDVNWTPHAPVTAGPGEVF